MSSRIHCLSRSPTPGRREQLSVARLARGRDRQVLRLRYGDPRADLLFPRRSEPYRDGKHKVKMSGATKATARSAMPTSRAYNAEKVYSGMHWSASARRRSRARRRPVTVIVTFTAKADRPPSCRRQRPAAQRRRWGSSQAATPPSGPRRLTAAAQARQQGGVEDKGPTRAMQRRRLPAAIATGNGRD